MVNLSDSTNDFNLEHASVFVVLFVLNPFLAILVLRVFFVSDTKIPPIFSSPNSSMEINAASPTVLFSTLKYILFLLTGVFSSI